MSVDPSSCHHMFVKTRTLHRVGLQKCFRCGELCFLFTEMRRCNVCNIYYHESCFQQAPAAQEQPLGQQEGVPTEPTPLALLSAPVHSHELHLVDDLRIKRCDICGWFIPLGKARGYACLECDFIIHPHCLEKVTSPYMVVDDATVQDRTVRSGDAASAVMTDTFNLLKQWTTHHTNWAWTVTNPIAMNQIVKEHSSLYIEACNSLKTATKENLPPNHLTDVRRALRFATAVYGIAYEAGNMSTALSAMLMRVGDRDMLRPKAEPNNIATMQVLRLPRGNLLHSKWGKDVFEPSYAVIVDEEAQWIVLAFRGSLSDQDFLTDACGHLLPFGDDAKAHAGILTMIDKVLADTTLLECLREQRALRPAWKVVVTGHSLGGGLTELFMMRAIAEGILGRDGITRGVEETPDARRARGLKRLLEPELCYRCEWLHGFAFAPPPVVTMPVADRFDEVITSVVVGKDMVPRLQLSSMDRLGARLSAHSRREGAAALASNGIADGVEECFIPGTILFSTKPNNVNTRLTFLDRTSILLRDVIVSPAHMVYNHLMDNYAAALAAVDQGLPPGAPPTPPAAPAAAPTQDVATLPLAP